MDVDDSSHVYNTIFLAQATPLSNFHQRSELIPEISQQKLLRKRFREIVAKGFCIGWPRKLMYDRKYFVLVVVIIKKNIE